MSAGKNSSEAPPTPDGQAIDLRFGAGRIETPPRMREIEAAIRDRVPAYTHPAYPVRPEPSDGRFICTACWRELRYQDAKNKGPVSWRRPCHASAFDGYDYDYAARRTEARRGIMEARRR